MKKKLKPLYRKENRTTHGSFKVGSKFKYTRHKKRDVKENVYGSMNNSWKGGYDYTPLFKFLLSKVGSSWDDVYSQAVVRLDNDEPIFWMVAILPEDKKDYFRCGENAYYSGLFVDENGTLQKVNPDINETTLRPSCHCCTHSFNGIRFTKKYDYNETMFQSYEKSKQGN